ncbi:MAG: hypothetical protein JRN67_01290 [Nitrososphaerota archaeon]|nr:hypothetical protein [Nitrososphaerota archaeon]
MYRKQFSVFLGLGLLAALLIIPIVSPALNVSASSPFVGSNCTSPNPPGTNCLTTFDNDFLWTSANEFYAPAAPFGTWSATPEGCYVYGYLGSNGICNAAPNGYANLGGSQDLGPITMSGSDLVTSIAGSSASGNALTFVQQASGEWVLSTTTLTYSSPTVTEYWQGELYFGGSAPSQSTFVNGTLVQWDYVSGSSNTQPSGYPDSIYDNTIGAWLISFNVYILENQCYPSGCPIPSSYFNLGFPSGSPQLLSSAEPFSNPLTLPNYVYGSISSSIVIGTPTVGAGVPEFGLPVAAVAAISMIGLVALRRFGFPKYNGRV